MLSKLLMPVGSCEEDVATVPLSCLLFLLFPPFLLSHPERVQKI